MNPSLREQADLYIDEHHQTFQELASELLAAFPLRNGHISTQVRNLQQIALSATRSADIEDFIKNQAGKESDKPGEPRWRRVGRPLLTQLTGLRQVRALKPAAAEAEEAGAEDQLRFRLMLARGWVRALVGEYLYRAAIPASGGPPR